MRRSLVCIVVALVCAASAAAELRLPAIFSDHMVLQADMPVAVWGWTTAGEAVRVRVGEASVSTSADRDGRWQVKLSLRL